MSSTVIDAMCQDCATNQQYGTSSEQLEGHATMCQACKDVALFKQPPPNEECPICCVQMPSLPWGSKYKSCCGKLICSGCIYAVRKMKGETKCPFCRVPAPKSGEEIIERNKERAEVNDVEAIYHLGCYYYNGERGLPQDWDKALELWHRAGELGKASAYCVIGGAYANGNGVERDIGKAKHYYELAAIGGNVTARYNLGILQGRAGNMSIALKHYMIAAGCGYDNSLKKIKEFYVNGHATKDDYEKALRAYQTYIGGIKSEKRDKAASYNDKYHYL